MSSSKEGAAKGGTANSSSGSSAKDKSFRIIDDSLSKFTLEFVLEPNVLIFSGECWDMDAVGTFDNDDFCKRSLNMFDSLKPCTITCKMFHLMESELCEYKM